MYNMYAFWVWVSSSPVASLPGRGPPNPFQYGLPPHMVPGLSGVEYQPRFVEQPQGWCIRVCICLHAGAHACAALGEACLICSSHTFKRLH